MSRMTIQGISDNVDALLKASDLFEDVEAAPQEGDQMVFSGFPSVSHYYSGTDSDYSTNTQHRRSITYTVEAVIVSPDTVTPVQRFKDAYKLADDVIQLFDASRDLSSSELNLTRACDILQPVPGELMRVATNHGDGLMITITLVCTADVAHR